MSVKTIPLKRRNGSDYCSGAQEMSSTCRRKKNATLNEFHSLEGSVSHLDGLKASFMGKEVGEDTQTGK